MRVDYQFNNKTWSYFHYNQFSVGSTSEEYPLTVGGLTGAGMNYFAYQNRWKFSTVDNDNDRSSSFNCADHHKSGFWYNYCIRININQQPPVIIDGVISTNSDFIDLLLTEMKIRLKDCIIHNY